MTDATERLPRDAALERPRTARPSRSLRGITGSTAARRGLVILLLATAWQAGASLADNPLLFPTFVESFRAWLEAMTREDLLASALASLTTLLKGYTLALALALALVSLAVASPFFREALQTLTAMFNPLPAIALLPLAMLWFGIDERSLLMVLIHSVLWPTALATLTGFESVPETQRLVGRNYGLRGPSYVFRILIPAALPSILSGLKIGWAFAWRTLIAAELVFGVTASQSGLGWFIFKNRNELNTDKVFAGLATVVLIGLLVEIGVFRTLERVTVRRWGMQR